MPADDDDWRLTNQESYLAGSAFVWRRWSAPKPEWDHDHCEFCWAKFGAEAGDDVLVEGWVTAEDRYHWVCAACFEDFRERFGWSTEPPSAGSGAGGAGASDHAEALLRCEAVAWVLPDEFPPIVEVAMTDAAGVRWRFHDKAPIFDSSGLLSPGTPLPSPVVIRVQVLDAGDLVRITTDPDGLESVEGQSEFVVRPDQLAPIRPS